MLKKTDWLVFAAVLILAAVALISLRKADSAQGPGLVFVEISIDGKFYKSVPLDGAVHTERIETNRGYNEILVDAGGVRVTSADCPEQVCVDTGFISRPGEIIVCLPHRVVITLKTITGTEADTKEGAVDAVAR